MKKTVSKESVFCDSCGKESYAGECFGNCGKEYCWECQKKLGKVYGHSVNFGGSGDGFFCFSCISNPKPKYAELLIAYQAIEILKNEEKSWYEGFKKRKEAAEERLEKMPRNK